MRFLIVTVVTEMLGGTKYNKAEERTHSAADETCSCAQSMSTQSEPSSLGSYPPEQACTTQAPLRQLVASAFGIAEQSRPPRPRHPPHSVSSNDV